MSRVLATIAIDDFGAGTLAAKEALVMAGGNPGCGRCAANIRTRM